VAFSQRGSNESLFLKSSQGVIDAAEQDFTSRGLLDLIRDGDPIGVVANPDDCQHHHQLEIAQSWCGCHLFEILEEKAERSKKYYGV
jgi:hypothetical protein